MQTRPADIDTDLLVDERDIWEELNEDDRPELETTLYSELSVTCSRNKTRKYAIGDTVLVSAPRKKPSIAVITAMWETRNPDEPDKEPAKKLRIHWFIRPSEMAAIRAKREYAEVRTFLPAQPSIRT